MSVCCFSPFPLFSFFPLSFSGRVVLMMKYKRFFFRFFRCFAKKKHEVLHTYLVSLLLLYCLFGATFSRFCFFFTTAFFVFFSPSLPFSCLCTNTPEYISLFVGLIHRTSGELQFDELQKLSSMVLTLWCSLLNLLLNLMSCRNSGGCFDIPLLVFVAKSTLQSDESRKLRWMFYFASRVRC